MFSKWFIIIVHIPLIVPILRYFVEVVKAHSGKQGDPASKALSDMEAQDQKDQPVEAVKEAEAVTDTIKAGVKSSAIRGEGEEGEKKQDEAPGVAVV